MYGQEIPFDTPLHNASRGTNQGRGGEVSGTEAKAVVATRVRQSPRKPAGTKGARILLLVLRGGRKAPDPGVFAFKWILKCWSFCFQERDRVCCSTRTGREQWGATRRPSRSTTVAQR